MKGLIEQWIFIFQIILIEKYEIILTTSVMIFNNNATLILYVSMMLTSFVDYCHFETSSFSRCTAETFMGMRTLFHALI